MRMTLTEKCNHSDPNQVGTGVPPELARMPGFGRVVGEANRELDLTTPEVTTDLPLEARVSACTTELNAELDKIVAGAELRRREREGATGLPEDTAADSSGFDPELTKITLEHFPDRHDFAVTQGLLPDPHTLCHAPMRYPFRGGAERVPNDEGDEIRLQNELAHRGEVLRDQLRRVMIIALPLELLLGILTGRTKIDYERSELPEDVVLTGAWWKHETRCLEIQAHHPSFLRTAPGEVFPRVLITVVDMQPVQSTEGLAEPAPTMEEMQALASEQKWEAKGGD